MKRMTLILFFLTFCAPAVARDNQPIKAASGLNESMATPSTVIPGRSARTAEVKSMDEAGMMERCQEMKEQKQKMKEDMKAQDEQLTDQLAEMNRAPEDKKMDLMAAVVTQMVERRISMDARKAKMEEAMMQHMMQHMQMGKESMAQCPMMKEMGGMKGMPGMKNMKGMDETPAGAHKELQKPQK
jgi:hypothetical protein